MIVAKRSRAGRDDLPAFFYPLREGPPGPVQVPAIPPIFAVVNGVRSCQAVAQTDFMLQQAKHERKKCILSNTIPITLSLSKGEQ